MKIPTLLFVEEYESTLSNKVILRKDLKLVLLRFVQNNYFSNEHKIKTAEIPTFYLDKDLDIESEMERFNNFCILNSIKIDYFYNDSEYNQEVVQKFANKLNLPGSLNEEQSKIVRDKAVMKKWLNSNGYRTMQYKELLSLDDAVNFADSHYGYPIIVKWRKGLSSKEVYKIESLDELKKLNIDYSKGRFIAETYCPHLIWCIDSIVQNGKVVATFLTWLPYTNLSFAETKEKFAQITVSEKPVDIKFDGELINQKIITSLNLQNGYIHLEAFVDDNGLPIICEFAWRTPGEHMLLNHSVAYDRDIYMMLVDVMIGKEVDPIIVNGKRCVGDMFLPIQNGKIFKISGLNELKEMSGVIDGEIKYKVGDVIETKRQYTDNSGWLQVEGDSKDDVLSKMVEIYKVFYFEIE